MSYWLWLLISFTPGHWVYYPLDGFESAKDCEEAKHTLESNFSGMYQEKKGDRWKFECREHAQL